MTDLLTELSAISTDLKELAPRLAAIVAERDALRAENDRLRKALERSRVAIDDWLNIHASSECDENRVAEAWARVGERGTLAYIADVQQQNRAAIESKEKA